MNIYANEFHHIEIVEDERYNHGALGAISGVLTSLKSSKKPYVGIMVVDQLKVRECHFRTLLASAKKSNRATYFDLDVDQPFPSIWIRDDLSKIEDMYQSGKRSIKGILSEINACKISGQTASTELMTNANQKEHLYQSLGTPLKDRFGRRIRYLRLSLTEACNIKCSYCLPMGAEKWLKQRSRLNKHQLETIVEGFHRLGIEKLRLTGGEPTIHPDCLATISKARQCGYRKIALTTNGILTRDLKTWAAEGLNQINVSLDTLQSKTFTTITGSSKHALVMKTIDQAMEEGLQTKVNTVLIRGQNDQEVRDLIRWALNRPLRLRFIELMPTNLNAKFDQGARVLNTEIEPILLEQGLKPQSSSTDLMRGPEKVWASPSFRGTIGLINPFSRNFCASCNRLRVTAKGHLRLCLFGEGNLPLPLTNSAALEQAVRDKIELKPEKHHLEDRNWGNVETFRTIGG